MRKRAGVERHHQSDAQIGLPTSSQVEIAVGALTLLADPTRLRLLWLLSESEHDVGTLADLTGTTPAAASQHLGKLRLSGLVSVRNVGRRRVYVARGGHVARLVQEALYFADHQVSGVPDHA